jgi:hypothetical protein
MKSADDCTPGTPAGTCGKWFFLIAFFGSCLFFWWLRSIVLRVFLGVGDSVTNQTIWTSVIAAACFGTGYLLPANTPQRKGFSEETYACCENFAYVATWILFLPAFILAVIRMQGEAATRAGGFVSSTPWQDQAVFYPHLFFGFMYMGVAQPEKSSWRRFWCVILLLSIPRLLVSLHGGRFFLMQAAMPVIIIAVARGWVRLSFKRTLQLVAVVSFIIIVPAATRGDAISGSDLPLVTGSDVLGLYQENQELNLNGYCPPLMVSLTAKIVPYHLLGMCVMDLGGMTELPATLERILTFNNPYSYQGMASGTGSNYLLELHISGGLPAVYIGSAVFGFTCRRFLRWSGRRSLFTGIWVECLTRALLAPRGNIGYVYERIPSLIFATLFVIFIVQAGRLLTREHPMLQVHQ